MEKGDKRTSADIVDRLRHDIERHIQIATDLANEPQAAPVFECPDCGADLAIQTHKDDCRRSATFEMLTAQVALLKECHDASNEALRSAMEIAKRNGSATNWEGHRAQLRHALEVHHAAAPSLSRPK